MSGFTYEFDATAFDQVCRELARMSEKPIADVVLSQTAAVLRNCMQHTPVAHEGQVLKRISKHYMEFPNGEIISTWKQAGDALMFLDNSTYGNFSPKKGDRAPALHGAMSWHQMNADGKGGRHWSDKRWAKFQSLTQQMTESYGARVGAALQARGITAQTWVQCAADLGVDIHPSSQIRDATPSNGQTYKNGTAQKILQASSFYIEVRNDNPILMHFHFPGGEELMQRAINARVKAFEIESKKGVFDDMALRAKRYPGIFTNN